MVAATFPNLSFENPPGTGPTLLSGASEPFVLTSGAVLQLSFAGMSESVVFLDTDFVDISAASASEVAAVIEAQIEDLGATDDGGFVRLISLLTGEDVTLEIVPGGANTQFAFPIGAVTGETFAGGPPFGWAVTVETDSVTEFAIWSDENGRPEEIFDEDGWVLTPVSDDFETAIFDQLTIPAPFETFTAWSSTGFLVSFIAEAAAFGAVNLAFEDFETEWGLPTYFQFTAANLITGISPEDFETSWGQAGPPQSPPVFSPNADFANATKTAEDFEDVVETTHIIEIITEEAGEWRVSLDTETYVYQATALDTSSVIALALATAIASGSVRFTATAFLNVISIRPTNPNDTDFNVTAARPPGGIVQVFDAIDFPALAEEWVGPDINTDFN